MTTIQPFSPHSSQPQPAIVPDSLATQRSPTLTKPLTHEHSNQTQSSHSLPLEAIVARETKATSPQPSPLINTNPPSQWRYESAVEKVESIIHQIETGNLELADVFDQFAIAVQHLHDCEVFLQHHRQQVDILVETLTDEPGSTNR